MKSSIEYDKKIAKQYHNVGYYESEGFHKKNLGFMEEEKIKHKTKKKGKVTIKIKELLNQVGKNDKVFQILEKIYKKNQDFAFNKTGTKPINSDLLNLLADENLLLAAYKKVRKNKGATTQAYEMSEKNYKSKNEEQKSWINKTTNSPDGINRRVFRKTSKFIKENKYPWGSSRRIYVEKPGKKGSKRPITIPPFMDKVVEEAITMILTSIYEPYFEAQNCSFGFRPNKGVHDAIISLTGAKANGLNLCLEGDVKGAYDRVSKKKLIEILNIKIQDRKFLNFMKDRLNYEIYDTEERKYITPENGLPQGGIDSPYLWNIYISIFNEFIINSLGKYLDRLNTKVRGKNKDSIKNPTSKEKRNNEKTRTTLNKISKMLKNIKNDKEAIAKLNYIAGKTVKELKQEKILTGELNYIKKILKEIGVGNTNDLSQIKKNIIKYGRSLTEEGLKLPSRDSNKIKLRFIYCSYADDWIILTNMKRNMLETWKIKIQEFLKDELHAELAMEKTLITDIREKPAHFLGFEISTYKNKKIGKYKKIINGEKRIITAITAGSKVFAYPDKQRLINRAHMKGYCDENGFPREVGFLSNLDDFTIIERYNSVLRGISNYYTEFIRNPRTSLTRWIYIIRYSCIKTLAQKHKTTIREIFKQYAAPISKESKSKEKTIEVIVKNKIGENTYIKKWRLLTTRELIENSLALKIKPKLQDRYWTLEKGEPIIYEEQDKHAITNDNFYDKLKWVNIRTQASFDLPCSICGSEEEIEMHHINHVRKNRYNLIDKEQTWLQAMYIRNRKQIPVCKECHINIIHKGKYGGTKLSYMSPKVMYDNRIITIESHINKGSLNKEKVNQYSKTLEEKGWIKEQES